MNQFVELHNLGLRASPEDGGSVNVAVAGEYQEGEQIMLRALPNEEEEYYFLNWTRGGILISDSLEFVYTMTGKDALLIANFQKDSPEIYTLDILIEPAEGGQVIVKVNDEEQQAPYSFEEGTLVVLEAIAEDNYTFVGWQAGNQTVTDNPITFPMQTSYSVTAHFDLESNVSDVLGSKNPRVFPNPAKDLLQIQSPFRLQQLEIFDARGVLIEKIVTETEQKTISVAHLYAGFYLIKMYSGNNVYVQKFQVAR
jgi:uncharacterized repeat protein (TIGR02543 family)